MECSELYNMLQEVASRHAGLCLSGGAPGADLMWAEYAKRHTHGVIHWSFDGHRTTADPHDLVILSTAELQKADEFCERANRSLNRQFPAKSSHTTNLLRRDWYQANFSNSCYAISKFGIKDTHRIEIGEHIDPKHKVDGGTAWAVQIFIDRFDGAECDCYVFDQIACYWFKWTGAWQRIYAPPFPQGIWAGVGKRDLRPQGQLAIRTLMDQRLM